MNISGWQWIFAILFGLVFFVVFSASYGILTYTRPTPKYVTAITPADLGAAFEDVRITTADGIELAAWFIPAQSETAKAVLLLHGYPADKGDILWSMIFLREEYNLLFLDFRHFGQSEGSYSTIGIKETQDVLAGASYLRNERGMERIGIWGFSMGGAAALMALDQTENVDAVVSDSSYASLGLMAEEAYRTVPGLNKMIAWFIQAMARLFLDIDLEQQSPVAALKNAQLPILLIHSRDDEVIPFSHAVMLQEAAAGNEAAEFWFRQSSGHGYLGSPEYHESIKDFFARNL